MTIIIFLLWFNVSKSVLVQAQKDETLVYQTFSLLRKFHSAKGAVSMTAARAGQPTNRQRAIISIDKVLKHVLPFPSAFSTISPLTIPGPLSPFSSYVLRPLFIISQSLMRIPSLLLQLAGLGSVPESLGVPGKDKRNLPAGSPDPTQVQVNYFTEEHAPPVRLYSESSESGSSSSSESDSDSSDESDASEDCSDCSESTVSDSSDSDDDTPSRDRVLNRRQRLMVTGQCGLGFNLRGGEEGTSGLLGRAGRTEPRWKRLQISVVSPQSCI